MTRKQQFYLYMSAVAAVAMAMGLYEAVFNNYLADTFPIQATERGALEFPRELQGFLVVLMYGLLCRLAIVRLGVIATGLFGLGVIGLALIGDQYLGMLSMMILASLGMHLLMPVGTTIILELSDEHNRGWRMGQVGMVGAIASAVCIGLFGFVFKLTSSSYSIIFISVGVLAFISALIYANLHMPNLHAQKIPLVVKKKFRLFYVLELLFGARKQIFITFGPWVLVTVYELPVSFMVRLFFAGAVIGIFFRPFAGWLIDHIGEKKVLMIDGLVLCVVCLGYGFAAELAGGNASLALSIACCCFVLDQMLFALGTGRSVYVSRLADNPQELNATLALGVSIDHIVSMSIPFFAGILWLGLGYQWVFMLAAVLALVIAVVASRVPEKAHWSVQAVPAEAEAG